MRAEHQAIEHDDGAQSVGKRVGAILLVPRPVRRHELPFGIHVRFVFRRWMFIEEIHRRAVGDEWHDPVRFVFKHLQSADPKQHDNQSRAGQRDADAIRTGRESEETIEDVHAPPS